MRFHKKLSTWDELDRTMNVPICSSDLDDKMQINFISGQHSCLYQQGLSSFNAVTLSLLGEAIGRVNQTKAFVFANVISNGQY